MLKKYRRLAKLAIAFGLLALIASCGNAQNLPSKPSTSEDEAAMQAATKFIAEIKSIDWKKVTQAELHERMKKAIAPFGWALNDARVARYATNRGQRTSVEVMIEPTGICIKQNTWLKLLGNPTGVTMGDPLGFLDVSTPESVQKALTGESTIASFHYSLNGVDSFSLEHQHRTFANQAPTNGCFHYLYVVSKF